MINENYLPNEELFIPAEKEAEYLASHSIMVDKLDNGITVVSAPRKVEDLAFAFIKVQFATGAYHDPQDKKGAHHLLEHVSCSPKLQDEAQNNGAFVNGTTSSSIYDFSLEGTSNLKVRNFGIWLYLERFAKMLKDPWVDYDDVGLGIDSERNIVRRELAEKFSSGQFKTSAWRNSILFDPLSTNVYGGVAGGTEEGLANTTQSDLEQLAQKVLIPDKTFIKVFTEGEAELSREIHSILLENFADFPNGEQKSNPVDQSLDDLINPKFESDGIYIGEFDKDKAVRQVDLIWVVPSRSFSKVNAILNRVRPILSQTANEYVRSNGLSYGASFKKMLSTNNSLCVSQFKVDNRKDIGSHLRDNIIPAIQREWLYINDSTFSLLDRNEESAQLAKPLMARDRFSEAYGSLRDLGRMIDSDKMKASYSHISVEDLKTWRDYFAQVKPAIFVY